VGELLELELFEGRWIFRFDGSVLEIFGRPAVMGGVANSVRVHVKQLTVKTKGPDKKGFRKIVFAGLAYDHYLGFDDESAWDAFIPLFNALREGGARFEAS
jgi:hypothetical protein